MFQRPVRSYGLDESVVSVSGGLLGGWLVWMKGRKGRGGEGQWEGGDRGGGPGVHPGALVFESR